MGKTVYKYRNNNAFKNDSLILHEIKSYHILFKPREYPKPLVECTYIAFPRNEAQSFTFAVKVAHPGIRPNWWEIREHC